MAGLISRLLTFPERRALDASWLNLSPTTSAGVAVNEETAQHVSAVFACVRVIAEAVAQLPFILYERQDEGTKSRALNHPLYSLLHDLPNPEMTSFDLRNLAIGHVLLRGNAYLNIVRDRGGRVIEIWPLRPDPAHMKVKRVNKQLVYEYRVQPGDTPIMLSAAEVWRIPGLSDNGITGKSVIAYAMETIGLALAAEKYGSTFYKNNARPSGVLETPGEMSDAAFERLKKEWEQTYSGIDNAHRTAILEYGVSYKDVGIAQSDAQYLETRKFQRNEIASFFRVPPHMIGDLERATFSNIEQQSIDFVTNTLTPWLVRVEQSAARDLLTPSERGRYYPKVLVAGLLRGDLKTRYEAYSIGRQNGFLSANDIRRLEDMNPVEGGDVYLSPLNMTPAADLQAGEGEDRALLPAPEIRASEQAAAAARLKIVNSFMPALVDVLTRILKREANDIGNVAAKKLETGPAGFWSWLDEFYRDYGDVIFNYMLPVFSAFAELIAAASADDIGEAPPEMAELVNAYVARYTARHIGKSKEEIRTAIESDDPEEAIREMADRWRNERPETVAGNEGNRAANAIAKAVWFGLGVTKLVWVTSGSDTCDYCRALDGKVVGIDVNFMEAGEEFQPPGAAKPFKAGGKIGHPPLHKGCNCGIAIRKGI